MLYPIFESSAEPRLQRLQDATRQLEAVWKQDFSDEPARLDAISQLSRAVDENCSFELEDLSPGLRDSLALEGTRGPLRVTLTADDGSLRLRAEPGLDVRLQVDGPTLTVHGRRRPAFHLYEYLTTKLGPGLTEDSRLESMERVVERRRDAEGRPA